jgi:hypothetical protein
MLAFRSAACMCVLLALLLAAGVAEAKRIRRDDPDEMSTTQMAGRMCAPS